MQRKNMTVRMKTHERLRMMMKLIYAELTNNIQDFKYFLLE